MIIIDVRNHVAPKGELIQDHNMIETLSADGADEALDIGCLPRRSESGQHFGNVQAFDLSGEGGAIDAVTIPEQVPRRLIPRECRYELRCGPLGGWMLSDVEMHNAPAIVSQNKKHVQDRKSDGGHDEKVHGNQLLDVVFQKRPPTRGRWFPMLHRIFRNRGLRNLDSKFEQFRV